MSDSDISNCVSGHCILAAMSPLPFFPLIKHVLRAPKIVGYEFSQESRLIAGSFEKDVCRQLYSFPDFWQFVPAHDANNVCSSLSGKTGSGFREQGTAQQPAPLACFRFICCHQWILQIVFPVFQRESHLSLLMSHGRAGRPMDTASITVRLFPINYRPSWLLVSSAFMQ